MHKLLLPGNNAQSIKMIVLIKCVFLPARDLYVNMRFNRAMLCALLSDEDEVSSKC